MATVRHYRELVVWQKGVDLVVAVYRATAGFPRDEGYGLTGQMRRCAVSVPSNIAEGQGRGSTDEFRRFLRIANGSRQELETQIVIAERLGYLDEAATAALLEGAQEVGRLIAGLLRSLD